MMEDEDDPMFNGTDPYPEQLSVLEQFDLLEQEGKIMNRTFTCEVRPHFGGEFPLYLAMAKFRVTPTGFTKPMDDLFYKIVMMCGEISTTLDAQTTHLLASHAYTQKMEIARSWRLPVITVPWVENLWNACQQSGNPYLHASQPQFVIPSCPLFYNMKFIISVFFGAETIRDFSDILMKLGGVMRKAVKKSNIYFYICLGVEDTPMFLESQALGVRCVTPGWINEAIRTGHLPAASKYQIKTGNEPIKTLVRQNPARAVPVPTAAPVAPVPAVIFHRFQPQPIQMPTATVTSAATATMGTSNNNDYDPFADFDYCGNMDMDVGTGVQGASGFAPVPLGMSMRQMCSTVEDLTAIGRHDEEGIRL